MVAAGSRTGGAVRERDIVVRAARLPLPKHLAVHGAPETGWLLLHSADARRRAARAW